MNNKEKQEKTRKRENPPKSIHPSQDVQDSFQLIHPGAVYGLGDPAGIPADHGQEAKSWH